MVLQWPLILFTFFVCASSGTLFMQGVLTLLGKGEKMQLGSLLTSLILLAVGGVAVFLHLEHWERMFNGFGHITSGITQEVIGIVIMAIAIVLFFMFMRRSEDGVAPKWTAWASVIAPVVMVYIMAHSYNMPALPAWDTLLLQAFYLVNMVLLGAAISLVISYAAKSPDGRPTLALVELGAAAVELVVIAVYAIYLNVAVGVFSDVGNYFDPTLPDVAMVDTAGTMSSIFAGSLAVPFWIGVVVLLVADIVLMMRLRKQMLARDEADIAAEAAPDGDAINVEDPLGTVLLGMIKSIPAGIKAAVGKTPWQVWVAMLCTIVASLCWRCILYVDAQSMFAIFLH